MIYMNCAIAEKYLLLIWLGASAIPFAAFGYMFGIDAVSIMAGGMMFTVVGSVILPLIYFNRRDMKNSIFESKKHY